VLKDDIMEALGVGGGDDEEEEEEEE